ncbi:MAG: TdeIII family type II restriction endonuclease [Gammaproteobacteria bacterium]|nr:TdeIII family type II restriction endonuclease [Gammaproteobacteria bacterium]
MMDRVMDNVLLKDPFDSEKHKREKRLYAALVPDEVFIGSHFERRFVTSFGKVWENLMAIIGKSALGFAETDYHISGEIPQGCLQRIQETLDSLEHTTREKDTERVRPSWDAELAYVTAGSGTLVNTTVISDVFVSSARTAPGMSFEFKAPQPNSDQTKVTKEKIFKLHCMRPKPVKAAYFALPYNPYGERKDYNWTFPMRWFDMRNDPCVLMGEELWDMVGGHGTGDMIFGVVDRLGKHYRQRIREEYLRTG